MTKFYYLLVLVFCASTATAQKIDCKKVRNGKFKMVDEQIGTFYFERKGRTQFESSDMMKTKTEHRITWLDDCTYNIQLTRVHENPYKINFEDYKELIIKVNIIEITETGYLAVVTSNQSEDVQEIEVLYADE